MLRRQKSWHGNWRSQKEPCNALWRRTWSFKFIVEAQIKILQKNLKGPNTTVALEVRLKRQQQYFAYRRKNTNLRRNNNKQNYSIRPKILRAERGFVMVRLENLHWQTCKVKTLTPVYQKDVSENFVRRWI